ncbi:hypothetical protein GGS21DRAFT_544296 [Xylaria nigripes]|nr:hypothetical protein GGS21DRAFT_544296 [Xylaria nigripes]
MGRRNSTKPRWLNRRKSATSVRSVHLEHIAPDIAERHAQVAASQAFAKAEERSTTDPNSSLWPPPRSAGSSQTSLSYPSSTMTPAEEAALLRQPSIRFVYSGPEYLPMHGTMAQNTRSSHTSRMPTHPVTDGDEVNTRPLRSASASGLVSATRGTATRSTATRVTATRGTARDYFEALFTRYEFYPPEDGIAPVPSSHNNFHESKSMDTNAEATTVPKYRGRTSESTNQLPYPNNHNTQPFRDDTCLPTSQEVNITRSKSFFRDLRGSFVPTSKRESNYTPMLSTTGHPENQDRAWTQSLRSKSTRFFRTKASIQDRAFKKSMRETNDTVLIPNNGSLRIKARRVSQGVKYKLKSLFGRSRDDNDELELPQQHIEAQESYAYDVDDIQRGTDEDVAHASPTNHVALSQVASGMASLHTVPPYKQFVSHKGSMESLQSEQKASDDRSRVTSWSNSDTSAANSLCSSREERDRKRLSVINENGAHVCSSSAQFAPISEPSDTSTTPLHQPAQANRAPVDSRGVYLALLERIAQTQEAQNIDPTREQSAEDFDQQKAVSHGESSRHLQHSSNGKAATIRYVLSENASDSESLEPNNSESTYRDNTGDVLSKNVGFLSLPQKKDRPALAPTVSSRSSAFFGSPTRHLFRTQSPYRRALQERMKVNPSNEHAGASTDFNPWMRSLSNIPNLPMPYSSTYGSDADIKLQYTESVYSTEDGPAKGQSILSVAENFQRPKSTHGDVTIFVNAPSYEKRSSSLPPKPRVVSSSSSVEWKTWLSSNVSRIEESTAHVDTSDFQYGLSSTQSSRHVRENAQIIDEDDQISGPPDTPSRVCGSADGHKDVNWFFHSDSDGDHEHMGNKHVDEVDDEGEDCEGYDADLPVPFDAGDIQPELTAQPPCANFLPVSASASSAVFPVTPVRAFGHNSSTGRLGIRDRALRAVSSHTSKQSISNGRENIATKLMRLQPTFKTSMTSLTNRTPGGDRVRKAGKLNESPQNMVGIGLVKRENVSPAIVDDDPYDVEGAGMLEPKLHGVGSKRMVDLFLSSRRRRMASSDDGSVFL